MRITRSFLDTTSTKPMPFLGTRIVAPLTLFAFVCLGPLFGGCSCTRQPAWDSGLRDSEHTSGADTNGANPVAEQDSQEGSGSGTANQPGDSGNGASAAGGAGIAATDGEKGVEGSAADGKAGESADGSAEGGTRTDGTPLAGNEAGKAAGTGDDASEAPAALPGRPRPKPRYDAATAVEVAERHLRRASSNRADGDIAEAYGEALAAFEAVEPHAAADSDCSKMLGRAKRVLADLAELHNRESSPRPVPTLFE